LKKALHGTLCAALLFLRKLTAQLQEWGFIINQYNWCVANKIINNKQCTVMWHVDDLKISHADPTVVSDVIELINGVFGNEAPVTVNRGKEHDYLGIHLDYTRKGKVIITMIDYIQSVLREAQDDMSGIANSPAANHLFSINTVNPDYLNDEDSEFFSHNGGKATFFSKTS
jgi:hypothetical protein